MDNRIRNRIIHKLYNKLTVFQLLCISSIILYSLSLQLVPLKHTIPLHFIMKRSSTINNKYRSSISSNTRISTRYDPNVDIEKQSEFFQRELLEKGNDNTIINTNEMNTSSTAESLAIDNNSFSGDSNKDADNEKTNKLDLLAKDTGNQIAFMDTPFFSILLLNLVTVIWGTQHAIIKQVLVDNNLSSNNISASDFTLARFIIALMLVVKFTPPLPGIIRSSISIKDDDDDDDGRRNNIEQNSSSSIWRWGIELGIWMFLGYAFQAIGLQYTTAQRSGFLLYLNVKFVPFFAYLLFRRTITLPTWLSALTAVIGTYLIAYEDNSSLNSINIGDIWSLAAAAASAMFILRLECASKAMSSSKIDSASSLNASCLWTVTIASAIWCIFDPASSNPLDVIQAHPFAIIYLGGVTTALANYIQTKAQRDISAERASVIYAMDPVYGAFFSYIILGETMGTQGYFGAFLISCAAITNAILDFGSREES